MDVSQVYSLVNAVSAEDEKPPGNPHLDGIAVIIVPALRT